MIEGEFELLKRLTKTEDLDMGAISSFQTKTEKMYDIRRSNIFWDRTRLWSPGYLGPLVSRKNGTTWDGSMSDSNFSPY